ncbi:MAG: NAD(P)H-binding protein [Candidatus Sulfotelmatobacter sp.]
MRFLLLGATGLVGRTALKQALAKDAISEVVAPSRRPLVPQNKLVNPVNLRLDELAPRVKSWDVDAVICALGTTKAKAGSQEAFRYVDYTLPLVFAKSAHGAGVETFALVSAIGAATNSMSFYARTKGEVERDIQQIGFRSLTICRPSIIAGERSETRIAESAVLAISRALAPILPKKFHVNPAPVIAATLLDSVLTARPGCRWVFAEELN